MIVLKIILFVALIGGLLGFIFSGFRVKEFFTGFFQTGWGCFRAILGLIAILAFIFLLLLFII
jgi:hypothetical protein